MPELEVNAPLVERLLVGFIENEVTKAGFSRVVIGLSGGVDSSLCAYLAAKALGRESVTGVIMPYRLSSPESVEHARVVAKKTGVRSMTVDISDMVDAYFAKFPDMDFTRKGNKMARERMTVLYDQSAALGALVLGTSNKSELLLGYGTLYGDMAHALNPLGDLYKTQVWQMAAHVGVPEEIVGKAASADLVVGQTDEADLGFKYADVDVVLYHLVDLRYSREELIRKGFPAGFVDRVARLVQMNQYKRRLPVIAKVSSRTIDRDFRYARDWGI
ncbi:MAG: NAD+ synthase [Candidatus Tectomicrobia bacterium]|nr:NAD+ synthase [Candidatus Tectomicrobia bacterium]